MISRVAFLFIPIICISSYNYIYGNKVDYNIFILNRVNNIFNGYNYIYNTLYNTIYKPLYATIMNTPNNFIVYALKHYTLDNSNSIKIVDYFYNSELYTIIFDDTYVPDNILKKNRLNIYKKEKYASIIMVELVHKTTNKEEIVSDSFLTLLKRYAGPNEDFYNYIEQPIYINRIGIDALIHDNDIIDNIDNYILHITYNDMSIIKKNINII